MDLERIGTLVQIVANLAVIVSVLFVVVQVRMGVRMLREAAERNHMDKHQSVSRMMAENPQLAELWARGSSAGIAGLSAAERAQFVNFYTYVLRIWEELYRQHARGLIDEESWQANALILRDTRVTRGAQDAWAVRRHLFTAPFQDFYDSQDDAAARPLYDIEKPT